MIIRKRSIKGKFAPIPNSLLARPDLSWAAKGLLSYLISKPPNWQGRKEDILNHCPEMSDYAYKKITGELIGLELLIMRYIPNVGGKGVKGSYYDLGNIPDIEYEEPNESNESAND